MRTIIAGSREITDRAEVEKAISRCGWSPSLVLCGMAPGVDLLGKDWAIANKIPFEDYPADWYPLPDKVLDPKAGKKRNVTMGDNAEALIAVWDGRSPGTRHMIQYARQRGLRTFVHRPAVRQVDSPKLNIYDFLS